MTSVNFGGIVLEKYDCPPEYRHLIPGPEEYVPQGDEVRSAAVAAKHHKHLLFQGPTGCGKNAVIRWMAHQLDRPVIVLSLAEGTGLDQLIGVMVPQGIEGGGFTVNWSDGALPRAIRMGAWVVLDEINAAEERVLMRLHDFAAKGDRLFVYENPLMGDGFISPFDAKGQHNGFTMYATMNPADAGMYAGVKVLNEATLDRFLVQEMDYIGLTNAEAEARTIAKQAKVKEAKAMRIVTVFNQIRRRARIADDELAKTNAQPIYATASVRRAIDVAVLSKEMPMMAAAELGFINKVNRDDRPVVHKLFLDAFASADDSD